MREDKQQYGCVIFDDAGEHTTGYCSINGQKAKRIRGTQDLDSDIVWVTNLEYNHMFDSGFSSHVRFRRSDFLRRKVTKILSSFGLQHDAKIGVELYSKLLSRTLFLADTFFSFGYPYGRTLKQSIRENINIPDIPLRKGVIAALQDATEYWTVVEQTYGTIDQDDVYSFQIQPLTILKKIIDYPYPVGDEWGQIYASKLKKITNYEELVDLAGEVFLAKIVVRNINSQVNSLLNFGSGPAFRSSNRRWVTSVELEFLYEVADISVQQVWLPRHTKKLYPELQKKIESLDEICLLSSSYNLLFENIWCAIGTTLYPHTIRKNNLDLIFNPAAPFVRAIDRQLCFNAAIDFAEQGLEVVGYGAGVVNAQITKQNSVDTILQTLAKAQVTPPIFSFLSEDIKQELTKIQITNNLMALQIMYFMGDRQQIFEVDKQIIEAFNDNK